MAQVAVTYIWVVDVDDPNDELQVTLAAEEHVHCVSEAFANPVKVEVIEA